MTTVPLPHFMAAPEYERPKKPVPAPPKVVACTGCGALTPPQLAWVVPIGNGHRLLCAACRRNWLAKL